MTPHSTIPPVLEDCLKTREGPLRVFRGQRTGPADEIQTRLPSITFCQCAAVASIYAADHLQPETNCPHVIPAYLEIKRPVFDNRDDPFVEMEWIVDALGLEQAVYFACKHQDYIQHTNNWDENYSAEYDCVEDLLKVRPIAVRELYMDAYPLLDDPEFVDAARAEGFDGAIHLGNGESAGIEEYRVFDTHQIISAITLERFAPAPEIKAAVEDDLAWASP